MHGRPVVEPSIAYANVMLPGQELAVHTDVPEFRGMNRKVVPQWLLVVMHHSGLFDAWRMPIATGIAWFSDGPGGELSLWPDGRRRAPAPCTRRGPAPRSCSTPTRCSTASTPSAATTSTPPPVTGDAELVRLDDAGERWQLVDAATGEARAEYAWDELRLSVSWKAYCFADDAERDAWRTHADDLTEDGVLDRLVADLRDRGVVEGEPARDRDLGVLLIDTYVGYPATSVTTVFDAVGGQPFFDDLVERFYARVEDDPHLRPLYPDDLGPAKRGLALFLGQYWGGPAVYSAEKGHPRLRMRHGRFAIGTARARRVAGGDGRVGRRVRRRRPERRRPDCYELLRHGRRPLVNAPASAQSAMSTIGTPTSVATKAARCDRLTQHERGPGDGAPPDERVGDRQQDQRERRDADHLGEHDADGVGVAEHDGGDERVGQRRDVRAGDVRDRVLALQVAVRHDRHEQGEGDRHREREERDEAAEAEQHPRVREVRPVLDPLGVDGRQHPVDAGEGGEQDADADREQHPSRQRVAEQVGQPAEERCRSPTRRRATQPGRCRRGGRR